MECKMYHKIPINTAYTQDLQKLYVQPGDDHYALAPCTLENVSLLPVNDVLHDIYSQAPPSGNDRFLGRTKCDSCHREIGNIQDYYCMGTPSCLFGPTSPLPPSNTTLSPPYTANKGALVSSLSNERT